MEEEELPAPEDWVAPPHHESYLGYLAVHVLGLPYVILLLLALVVCAVLTLILIRRGKGIMAGVALVFIVPLPFVLGAFRAIQIGIDACRDVGIHPGGSTTEEFARALGAALWALWIGMLLTIPGYVIVAIGTLRRAFRPDGDDR